jgi:hypothetical protein
MQYRRDIGFRALERRRGSRKADAPPPAAT